VEFPHVELAAELRLRALAQLEDLQLPRLVSESLPALAQSNRWTARRQPFLLETSRPGVFAAGGVRSGSVKRVASAVGEGAMAVQFVHEYLKEM
jgi:thioredoxin reductase